MWSMKQSCTSQPWSGHVTAGSLMTKRQSGKRGKRTQQRPSASGEIQATTGVWTTIEFQCTGTTLSVYDTAPDSSERTCLASYPFPLSEEVQPYHPQNRATDAECAVAPQDSVKEDATVMPVPVLLPPPTQTNGVIHTRILLLSATPRHTVRSAGRLLRGTRY